MQTEILSDEELAELTGYKARGISASLARGTWLGIR